MRHDTIARKSAVLLTTAVTIGACGDGGDGEIAITTYGEAFIENGISADDMADGWAVTFSRFDVELRDIKVAGQTLAGPFTVNLAADSGGAGHAIATIVASAGTHRDHAFTVASIALEGSATLGATSKTFAWRFDTSTRYSECDTETSVDGRTTSGFEVTIHADHLFSDSLVAENLRLVFQPFADADSDNDGVISQAELAGRDIGSFDPGSAGGIDDLWSWLGAQARTLGHVDGEGHCDANTP